MAACAGPTSKESAAQALEGFLNSGYTGRAGRDFNLIRNASRSEIKTIFSQRFPDMAKYVDVAKAGPDQILEKMRYFYTAYSLSDGAPMRVKVDPSNCKCQGTSSPTSLSERSLCTLTTRPTVQALRRTTSHTSWRRKKRAALGWSVSMLHRERLIEYSGALERRISSLEMCAPQGHILVLILMEGFYR